MVKEQRYMPGWSLSARTFQKEVNKIYEEAHSIQDTLDLDED
jgi:hypothetical protein